MGSLGLMESWMRRGSGRSPSVWLACAVALACPMAPSALAAGGDFQPDRPAKAPASPAVPPDLKAKGKVYHALPGRERQVRFVSDAPFEKINGHSNAVVGYAVAGPDDNPSMLAGGEWRLPVASLRTGNTSRDEHLRDAEWLDAAKFPDITFKLKSIKDARSLDEDKNPVIRAYAATLVGDMTIHGVTKEMSIPATMRWRSASDATARLAAGDFLVLSCSYAVRLSDFGVRHDVIAVKKKVAEVIQIETQLLLTTVPPEEQPTRAENSKPTPQGTPPALPSEKKGG